MNKVLHIENLDCPVCAEALQSDLQKIKGVNSVRVDYVTQTITLDVEDESVLAKVIKAANNFEEVRVLDGGRYEVKQESHLNEWLIISLSAVFFVVAILLERLIGGDVAQIIAYVLYGIAYLLVGYPVLLSTAKNIVKGRIFDENFLMTVASIGAIALGEISEGVIVMLLYQLGELLQSIAVGSSRKSVTKLLELKSERAILLKDGEQVELSPEELKIGNTVLVKAGEKAPADGILLDENALLDVKSLTGEAELRSAKEGEEILSGSINAGGMYAMKIVRPYEDSAVGRILHMVETASNGKAKPEKFIAKFSKYYTPIVCALALLLALFAPLVSGLVIDNTLHFKNFDRWLQSALTFLVISCPCALVISVPLTYFSAIGSCAKIGVLVKGAIYLDVLATANTVAFDKTGTLTEGVFSIRYVKAEDEQELLAIVAAVEKGSSHPIAKAFDGVRTEYIAENVTECAGKGLSAYIQGEKVVIGNEKLLQDEGIRFPKIESVYTVVYVAKNGEYLGVIEIGDTIRKETKSSIRALETLGFAHRVMLTGDRKERAEQVANEVGMSAVKAELLPDEKLQKADALKKNGGLIYVGDGINDAPVMMTADCAVSMGKLGSAAAVEASDLVLISDNLTALPKAVKIARKCRGIVLQNILFSIAMKTVFMALSAIGILPLWLAVFADVGVMLLAVLNSFRVRL
jgi:Cd2+/Zn2+-exporting ATPase